MKSFRSWAAAALLLASCSHQDPTAIPDEPPVLPAGLALPLAPAAPPAARVAKTNHPRTELSVDGLPSLGPSDARVTIVEFTDYDCPFCARGESTMNELRKLYGGDLRLVVAMNPLPMHEHAQAVALFSLAAEEAGVFEQAHTQLFRDPTKHSEENLLALGRSLGLSDKVLSEPSPQAKAGLARSRALTDSLHVRGTPTFFINGRKITGAQPIEVFRSLVDEELAHARDLVASGVAPSRVYAKIMEEARSNPAPIEATEEEDLPFVAESKEIGGLHLMGKPKAAHTLVLFTDFECPFCARLDVRMRAFVASHPEVRVVLRQRPLPMHPNARLWAKAAIAAEEQGKLPLFAEKAFAQRGDKSPATLDLLAQEIGLDLARLHRDMESESTQQRLREDEALADKLHATGTPTSFLDGYKVVGAQLDATFERALAKSAAAR